MAAVQNEDNLGKIITTVTRSRITETYMTCGISRSKHVLVIVTGGTIAMAKDIKTDTLIPVRGFLKKEVRRTPTLHDQEYFRKYIRTRKLSEEEQTNTFVLPKYSRDEDRIIYTVTEYEVLLDSCNMHIDNYRTVANSVYEAYDNYDGFVVIHGTDTMAYTASYLSFMLENLSKPVILTGSQIPLSASRSDGVDNLQGAILIAGTFVIPEVTIFFHNHLFRGNRVVKAHSSNLNAYKSANIDPLMVLGAKIKTNWDIVWRNHCPAKFTIFSNLNPNVGLLRLFPGITANTVRAFIQPPIEGIVLQSYGAGNSPTNRPDILELLKDAVDRGVLIIKCTQCRKGGVNAELGMGKKFFDVGVVPGYDITPEAALAKLSYITAKPLSLGDKKDMLLSNIRGEISKKVIEHSHFCETNNKFVMAVARIMKLDSKGEIESLKLSMLPVLLCAAAKQNDVALLKNLQSEGVNLSLGDYDKRSALHIAVCEGHLKAVQFLVDNGASVHARDRFGFTPLVDALHFRRFKCVDILLRAGAHITVEPKAAGNLICDLVFKRDIQGLTAWNRAGVSLNETDYEGRTPLQVAVALKDKVIIAYLMKHGSYAVRKSSVAFVPLALAKKCDNDDIKRLLERKIENGTNT